MEGYISLDVPTYHNRMMILTKYRHLGLLEYTVCMVDYT